MGDRVLICNLSEREREREREREERERDDKMTSYWEEQIHIIVSSVRNDPVVCKIRPDHDPKGKKRTVCCNMLMHCHNLLYIFDWNI